MSNLLNMRPNALPGSGSGVLRRPEPGTQETFVAEVAGVLSVDTAADIDDRQAQDTRNIKSSAAFDRARKQKKRTPIASGMSLTTAALYAAAGIGVAYWIRQNR